MGRVFCDTRWETLPETATCPHSRWEGRVLPPDFNHPGPPDVAPPGEEMLVCGTLGRPQVYFTVMTHLPTQNWAAS